MSTPDERNQYAADADNEAVEATHQPADSTVTTTPAREKSAPPRDDDDEARWSEAFRRIVSGNWLVSVGAIVLAIIAGSIMIATTDENVQAAAKYFFTRPGDTFSAVGTSVGEAYAALFRGAVWNYRADGFVSGIRPLMNSLNYATPLIGAGLGLALGFRAGLFNIGGQGQMLVAAIAAGWIGFGLDMPWPLHMLVAMIAGIAAGALWAGIAGLLKAFTGAHEVIVTIMLNYIAFYALSYLLATPGLLQAAGSSNPKTAPMKESAIMPKILGDQFPLHLGFVFALVAVVFTWWLLQRSRAGFVFRAVGENPEAARVAGIDVRRTTVYVMLVVGGLVGLAGATQVLGTVTTGFSSDIDAGIGFDAITVALLGRSSPFGVLAAAILFGGFKAGGAVMQTSQGIPIEIVSVVQSLIVLFIAAPPLVRAVFRLPQPGAKRRPRRDKKEVAA
ncbi:ABC transporter permease [Sanguibacter antarcticus]|uniref:Nucleoside ABC transporter membrane protein n=1 Tax=Sanguibacter antarcticus TaxID=372484 RepID=A0A2A9E5T6_9MICO|nr:ABC transporter permease [Sanguibacter antarcticus]PFG33725.1 nucleoside ABC transporter membrane protein [Sanguibacter antarcticus]